MIGKEKILTIFVDFIIASIAIYLFTFNSEIKKNIIKLLVILNFLFVFNLPSYIFNKLNDISNQSNEFDVVFKIKPNIYVFSFESLAPTKIIKKHLGIDTKYEALLKKNNAFILKNNFADNTTTVPSLNSFLYIDQIKFRKLPKEKSGSFFSGRTLSPSIKIFKDNKYKINTGFIDVTFGAPGIFVDKYITFRAMENISNSRLSFYPTFCSFKMPWYHFQVFGYCDFINVVFNINKELRDKSRLSYRDYVASLIKKKENPQFNFFHISIPGHPNPDINNFKDYYYSESEKVNAYIEKLIDNINNNDPDAILIIMGDHSPLILHFPGEKKLRDKIFSLYSDAEKAYVLDRYPTFAAIYSKNTLCTKNFKNLKQKIFTTNSMILNYTLGCLFGNEDELLKNLKYNLPNGKDYLRYIYE